MNAKDAETNAASALGRGLDSLMTSSETTRTPAMAERPEACPASYSVALVGGLVAGGAAGAVAVAAFVLLGMKAVLSMERRR